MIRSNFAHSIPKFSALVRPPWFFKLLILTEYFSAAGATEYLDSDNYAKLTSIKLTINNYKNRIYFQKNLKDFISNLSIIDIIANIGWNAAASYVKNDA